MRKPLSHLLIAATVAAISIPIHGHAMAQTLSEPVTVPLEFLSEAQESPEWLQNEIAKEFTGASNWKIEDGKLVTTDVEVLKYANRIRAFLSLEGSSDERPYFVLPVRDEKGQTGTCVTRSPGDIIPELEADDFDEDVYVVPDLAAERVQACLVEDAASEPFATMDRATFLSTYFVGIGMLDVPTHEALKTDLGFIARAYNLGFFPYQGALSGYLQVQ